MGACSAWMRMHHVPRAWPACPARGRWMDGCIHRNRDFSAYESPQDSYEIPQGNRCDSWTVGIRVTRRDTLSCASMHIFVHQRVYSVHWRSGDRRGGRELLRVPRARLLAHDGRGRDKDARGTRSNFRDFSRHLVGSADGGAVGHVHARPRRGRDHSRVIGTRARTVARIGARASVCACVRICGRARAPARRPAIRPTYAGTVHAARGRVNSVNRIFPTFS